MRDYRRTWKDIVPTYMPGPTTLARSNVPSAGLTLAAACEDESMSFTNRCVCHAMTYYHGGTSCCIVDSAYSYAPSVNSASDFIVLEMLLIARIAAALVRGFSFSSLCWVIILLMISRRSSKACSSPGIFLYCYGPVARAGSGIPGGIRCGASYHSRSHIPCGINKA